MAKVMTFERYLPLVTSLVKAAEARFPSVESWGSVGLCWGGKVSALLSGAGTLFKVTAQVHPGCVSPVHLLAIRLDRYLEKIEVY